MEQPEKLMTERESIQLITEMIQRAKATIHERGTSCILWGFVTAVAGLVSFAENYFNFSVGFDIWWLVFAAIIPQIWISIREGRERKVVTYAQRTIDAIWVVYGISIGCYTFYLNVVPGVAGSATPGSTDHILSVASVLLILYAIPTLATGIITRFRPMIIGGVLCYGFFFISCYTSTTWDMLLLGIAGILNWLIPGFILRKRYLKGIPG